jgi:hypothetical protein
MEALIPLLIVVIIVGAILGGKSFGETISKGCGCLTLLAIIIAVIIVVLYSWPESETAPNNIDANSTSNSSVYFIVKQNCETYTKPDINSEVSGQLEIGQVFIVENVSRFNYFYELSDQDAEKSYVRKECLIVK